MPLTACDIALVKSGTSTLEAMLLRRPLTVVTHRLGFWTFFIAKFLVKTPHIRPQYFGDRWIVPEVVQQAATPEAMYLALLGELEKTEPIPNT